MDQVPDISAVKMTDISSFDNLIDVYVVARDEFGREQTLKALRRHYADSCSDGDRVIHALIRLLEDEGEITDMVATDEDSAYFADHIAENLEDWLDQGRLKPNPWWAS
jgi:pyruvate dehydrogenase complex dehydrogenase (E1) component